MKISNWICLMIAAFSVSFGIGVSVGNMVMAHDLERQAAYIERLENYIGDEGILSLIRRQY